MAGTAGPDKRCTTRTRGSLRLDVFISASHDAFEESKNSGHCHNASDIISRISSRGHVLQAMVDALPLLEHGHKSNKG